MRKFKHEPTGIIAKNCEMVSGHYELCNYKTITRIPAELIENSKEWKEIIEPKFKNSDIVKIIDKFGVSMMLLTDASSGLGYGLINGNWCEKKQINTDGYNWQLATEQEWLGALTKEAEKRGFKEGVKVKRSHFLVSFWNNDCIISKNGCDEYRFLSKTNTLEYYGSVILEDGIWAEVIKEETIEELAENFYNKYEFSPLDFKTFFNENKKTIHKLSK